MSGVRLFVIAMLGAVNLLSMPILAQVKNCDSNQRADQLQRFIDEFCDYDRPRTCSEVKRSSPRQVAVLSDGMEVLCDTVTDGGGWLVIQRRASAEEDFYRGWTDYKYGFGDLNSNFWFGNEKIHQLTQLRRYELLVHIVFENATHLAYYDRFALTGEDDQYRLRLGDFEVDRGNSSDGLGYHNNKTFTTKDRDNDAHSSNCATMFHGAWWYGSCHNSNLNGDWGNTEYAKGLTWHSTTGDNKNPSFTEMKIRPIHS